MGIFDVISSGFDAVLDFGQGILDSIGSAIVDAISTVIGKALYYILVQGLLSVVNAFYRLFAVFAGITKVDYDGEKDYLINVFFSNTTISNIYWGMAIIGIIMIFVFAIIAVIRKIFDLYDKQQRSLGEILTNSFKSFLIIICLSLFMTMTLNATNVLMQRVNYIFDHADSLTSSNKITYTDQQFATMARVFETVGNYSMNPSYDSRYNINSCFNEIRADLYLLQQEGVFDVYYDTKDEDGKVLNTWQSVLENIAYSGNLKQDIKLDVYYPEINTSILEAMTILRNDASFSPIKSYERKLVSSQSVSLDRILFLIGTTSAARNSGYNENPSFTDSLRGAFYTGEKSIYNIDLVMEAFEIGLGGINYLLIAVLGYLTLRNLWRCIIQCVVRIFSLLGLYVTAPPFIATMPLDDGEKFKQWVTSFIIQSFGIFGTVIPMRLLITFIPMILSNKLVIFADSAFLNLIAKAVLLLGGLEAVNRFGGIITGILANNASHQAIVAGNTDGMADHTFMMGRNALASTAKGVAGVASDVTGLTAVGNDIAGVATKAYSSIQQHGLVGSIVNALPGGEKTDDLPKNNGKMK